MKMTQNFYGNFALVPYNWMEFLCNLHAIAIKVYDHKVSITLRLDWRFVSISTEAQNPIHLTALWFP